MRGILNVLIDHVKRDFNPYLYGYAIVFMAASIAYNYWVDFEDTVLDSFYGQPIGIFVNILFFAVAWYGIAIPQALFTENRSRLKSFQFWGSSLAMISLIGFASGFHGPVILYQEFGGGPDMHFAFRIAEYSKPILIMIPLAIYCWMRYGKLGEFYGFHRKKFNHKPYALMLLAMLPLIAGASCFDDFLNSYPRFQPWEGSDAFGLPWQARGFIFELSYGGNLFFTEFMFRGMLVVGLARVLGKDAILPMVCAYAFLHFGKPVFETIGSIFGGYILGVVALHSRNILGGIWVHIGIAWSMELAAYIQHVLRGTAS